jgi:hypothetical protein
MERIGVSKMSNKVIRSRDRDIFSRLIVRCDEDRQCTPTPNRVYVFGTGITLPGRADVSQAAAGPCRLQLCAVLGSSGVKLAEYICNVIHFIQMHTDDLSRNADCRELSFRGFPQSLQACA